MVMTAPDDDDARSWRLAGLGALLLAFGCSGGDEAEPAPMGGSSGAVAPEGGAPGAAGAGGRETLGGGSGNAPSLGGAAAGGEGGAGGAVAPTGGSGGAGGTGAHAGVGGTSSSPGCGATSLGPGETVRTIDVGGQSRSFILHVPASYSGETPAALLLDFHGLFGNGALQRDSSGYLALSEEEGFIVAYPDGIDAAWNIGPCCTYARTVDDVAFARAIVATIASEGCVDETRVYAAGFSMGGGMSFHLACNAADVFAAVAPAAFDLLEETEQPCSPSRPISVITSRGTADVIVPYAGGPSNPPNGLATTIHFLGAEATFERWRTLNGCTDTPTVTGSCQTSSACNDGVEVTLCTAVGGGHVTGDARMGWAALSRHALP